MFFLGHLWIRNYNDIQLSLELNILIFQLIKAYICSPSLQKSALRVSTSVFLSLFLLFIAVVLLLSLNWYPINCPSSFYPSDHYLNFF
jgi:hypothetical protein